MKKRRERREAPRRFSSGMMQQKDAKTAKDTPSVRFEPVCFLPCACRQMPDSSRSSVQKTAAFSRFIFVWAVPGEKVFDFTRLLWNASRPLAAFVRFC